MGARCQHLHQKYVSGEGWTCRGCGEVPPKRKNGIREIVESGVAPQMDVEPDGYFSFGRGRYVKSRNHAHEVDRFLDDPERNPDHIRRPTPEKTRKWMDNCHEKGVVPGTPDSLELA